MIIGERVMQRVKDEISGLLDIHHATINQVFLDNDKQLSVKFTVKYEEGKTEEAVKAGVEISFVKEKVHEKITFEIDERQREIPFNSGPENIDQTQPV